MPQVKIRVGGVTQTISRVKGMADLRTFKRIRVMVAGVMQTVFQSISATLTPDNVFGVYSDPVASTHSVTTSSSVVSVSGGTAPFTYAWSLVASDGFGTWTANSPTSAVSAFTASGVAPDTESYATFKCVVTDSTGSTATTNGLNVIAYNVSGP